jgi:hypothetical protein
MATESHLQRLARRAPSRPPSQPSRSRARRTCTSGSRPRHHHQTAPALAAFSSAVILRTFVPFNPVRKRSMRMQGVRRPASSITAVAPSLSKFLKGNCRGPGPSSWRFRQVRRDVRSSRGAQFIEEFAWDRTDLAQVRKAGLPTRKDIVGAHMGPHGGLTRPPAPFLPEQNGSCRPRKRATSVLEILEGVRERHSIQDTVRRQPPFRAISTPHCM